MTIGYDVNDLVPHSGKMSLLSKIVDAGDDWLSAEVTINEESMFAETDGVPAWVGLEYMAQTIAAFAGFQERLNNKPPKLGFLLGTRKLVCGVSRFPIGSVLSIRAEREMQTENGLSVFNCTLSYNDVNMSAVLNVFQPDNANSFLKETGN